jgi:hypothetical protein
MMRNGKLKAISCTISRGGFSDERVFTFDILGGKERYSGVASRRHMWNADGTALEEGEPPIGKTMSGFVAARVLEARGSNLFLVSIPDGGVVEVPSGQLVDRPSGVDQHVSV